MMRRHVVRSLVARIWDAASAKDRTDPETVYLLRESKQELWDLVAHLAGTEAPTREEQLAVVREIARRVRAARWGLPRRVA